MLGRLGVVLILIGVGLSALEDRLFQVATYQSLMEGELGGNYSIEKLTEMGDLGYAVLESAKGEVIFYKGNGYYADSQGKLKQVKNRYKASFAQVTHFNEGDSALPLKNIRRLKLLQEALQSALQSENRPSAILIRGKFTYVKMRALKPQKPPYLELASSIQAQTVYHCVEEEGVMVGFWIPAALSSVMGPGLTFYFMNQPFKKGGAVLDVHIDHAKAFIQPLDTLEVYLPK